MEQPGLRILSSRWTPISRVLFAVLWLAVGGALTASIVAGYLKDTHGNPPPVLVRVLVPLGWALGLCWWKLFLSKLLSVGLWGERLVVWRGRRRVEVPLGQILDLKVHRWIRGQPITLRFAVSTEFGDQVTFLPKTFTREPVARQLAAAVAQAKGAS